MEVVAKKGSEVWRRQDKGFTIYSPNGWEPSGGMGPEGQRTQTWAWGQRMLLMGSSVGNRGAGGWGGGYPGDQPTTAAWAKK